MPSASEDAIDLITVTNSFLKGVPYSFGHISLIFGHQSLPFFMIVQRLCSWDPCKRPTAAEALQHPFFKVDHRVFLSTMTLLDQLI